MFLLAVIPVTSSFRFVGETSPFHSLPLKQTSFPLAHLIGVGIAIARDPLPDPDEGRSAMIVPTAISSWGFGFQPHSKTAKDATLEWGHPRC